MALLAERSFTRSIVVEETEFRGASRNEDDDNRRSLNRMTDRFGVTRPLDRKIEDSARQLRRINKDRRTWSDRRGPLTRNDRLSVCKINRQITRVQRGSRKYLWGHTHTHVATPACRALCHSVFISQQFSVSFTFPSVTHPPVLNFYRTCVRLALARKVKKYKNLWIYGSRIASHASFRFPFFFFLPFRKYHTFLLDK